MHFSFIQFYKLGKITFLDLQVLKFLIANEDIRLFRFYNSELLFQLFSKETYFWIFIFLIDILTVVLPT